MSHKTYAWKGFVLGAVGASVGLLAMEWYWKFVAPTVSAQLSAGTESKKTPRHPQESGLDDISLIGKQYEDEESSTEALGRIFYTGVTGKPPKSKEGKTILNYLVHWSYGSLQGGLYGATIGADKGPDVLRGILWSTSLWFFGDEITVPLLGLQAGPTGAQPVQHLNRLGAHWAYGIGTALATGILNWIFQDK